VFPVRYALPWRVWGASFRRDEKRPPAVLRELERGLLSLRSRALHLAASRLAENVK